MLFDELIDVGSIVIWYFTVLTKAVTLDWSIKSLPIIYSIVIFKQDSVIWIAGEENPRGKKPLERSRICWKYCVKNGFHWLNGIGSQAFSLGNSKGVWDRWERR